MKELSTANQPKRPGFYCFCVVLEGPWEKVTAFEIRTDLKNLSKPIDRYYVKRTENQPDRERVSAISTSFAIHSQPVCASTPTGSSKG